MISRRLIRIKVFKVLFSRISSESDSITASEKELLHSCEKTLDLYYFFLLLLLELKKTAEHKIETGLSKFQPTAEEINPNRKFVNNRLLALLGEDTALAGYCKRRGLNWTDHLSFVKKLYQTLCSKDYFISYMTDDVDDFKHDTKLIITFFEEELEDSEDLYAILEDLSIYWADDVAYVINVIIKKLLQATPDCLFDHPDIFLKDDDKEYAVRLLDSAMANYREYSNLISRYLKNWDTDRLASTDIILIIMGIAEAVAFPNIPLKVSMNEYVELSKYYSTPNSRIFVNGMLDKILISLQEEGKIEKKGRGLSGS